MPAKSWDTTKTLPIQMTAAFCGMAILTRLLICLCLARFQRPLAVSITMALLLDLSKTQVQLHMDSSGMEIVMSNWTCRAQSTSATGINDAGQVVGYYFANSQDAYGFVKDGATYTTIHVPGADDTIARGINNAGQIVGSYAV